MPPKRKRPNESQPAEKPLPTTTTRRATRHTPIPPPTLPPAALSSPSRPMPPPPAPADPPRKRGRPPSAWRAQQQAQLQAQQQAQQQARQQISLEQPQQSQYQPLAQRAAAIQPPRHAPNTQAVAQPSLMKWTGPERNSDQLSTTRTRRANIAEQSSIASKENVQPAGHAGPDVAMSRSYGRPQSVVNPPLYQSSMPQQSQRPTAASALTPKSNTSKADKQSPRTDRNIDKVVLGNICFKTWYPSYYGKEVIGDTTRGDHAKGPHSRRDREGTPMLDRLYVCPCCFKYSKELVMWLEHVRICEQRAFVPGKKIYVHPKGMRSLPPPPDQAPKLGRKRRADASSTQNAEQARPVKDEGEWSIWEVDGEKDVLFCQNLSLFAKLFLDNKSVFFDVTSFNYFLLVYSRPTPPSATETDPTTPTVQHHICGFFSKEKMSWDNNNLACILVFPPWQRKGLGALLMGVSYEISRREGILGGPEKPISDLGKKGYKRFWAGEIARWILGLDLQQQPLAIPSGPSATASSQPSYLSTNLAMPSTTPIPLPTIPGAPAQPPQPPSREVVIDIHTCSQATWITPEDCLLVLREMGVAEDAGMGPPTLSTFAPNPSAAQEADEQGNTNTHDEPVQPKQVQRVRIARDAVRTWVAANHINLERVCDPQGFEEGYAMKEEAH